MEVPYVNHIAIYNQPYQLFELVTLPTPTSHYSSERLLSWGSWTAASYTKVTTS